MYKRQALNNDHFRDCGLHVYEGTMITVLGTSLQNKDILTYFMKSSWKAIGLEMEGAHYQKAIQSASKIRKSIHPDVTLRYAYYASDNPLETGSTLASGSLGLDGVKPTYLITIEMLKGCLLCFCTFFCKLTDKKTHFLIINRSKRKDYANWYYFCLMKNI